MCSWKLKNSITVKAANCLLYKTRAENKVRNQTMAKIASGSVMLPIKMMEKVVAKFKVSLKLIELSSIRNQIETCFLQFMDRLPCVSMLSKNISIWRTNSSARLLTRWASKGLKRRVETATFMSSYPSSRSRESPHRWTWCLLRRVTRASQMIVSYSTSQVGSVRKLVWTTTHNNLVCSLTLTLKYLKRKRWASVSRNYKRCNRWISQCQQELSKTYIRSKSRIGLTRTNAMASSTI